MRDAARGEKAEHILERDDGYLNETSGEQYIAPLEEWHETEKLAVDLIEGRVLDIGCGAGRVAIYLQKAGHDVVGIDISPLAVETARERGLREVHLMSAADLDFPEKSFNAVILFGNNFGILGDPEAVVGMLEQLHKITFDDGIILAQSRNVIDTEEKHHLDYHSRNRAQGKPPGLVKLRMRYKGGVTDWWNLLMSTPDEMGELAERANWKLERTISKGNLYVGVLRKR